MTKKEMKKLTIADLINEKEKYQVKKGEKKDLYLEQKDRTITIIKPEKTIVLDAVESESDDYMVYEIVVEPNLKDAELQKAFECVEPMDIVSKLFDPGTIKGIAQEGLKFAGYESKVKVVDELKN